MAAADQLEQTCPVCGIAEWRTEPALDETGTPTGGYVPICPGCGFELGELPPSAPSDDTASESQEVVPIEGAEEPRLAPIESRRRGHRVWP